MILPRFLTAYFSLAIISSAFANWTLPFDQDIDFDILSPTPANAWKLTPQKTLRFDSKVAPRGDLAFVQTVELTKLSFKLLPVEGEIPANAQRTLSITEKGGAVYTLVFDNKNVTFTATEPGKPAVPHVTPMAAALAKGGTLDITRDKEEVVITNEGTEVARFPAPEEPVRIAFKFTAVPAEFSEIQVGGGMWAEAPKRESVPVAKINWNDPSDVAFYPPWPIKVPAPASGLDLSQAAAAPAVSEWKIGQEDFKDSEFLPALPEPKPSVDFVVSKNTEKEFPRRLGGDFERRRLPNTVRIFFNLKSEGDYTLRLFLAAAKNILNIVSIKVDGHLVQKDIYRGANPLAVHSIFRDAIPLMLEKGPHVLEIQLEARQTHIGSRAHSIIFDSLSLLPGDHPVVYERKAGERLPLSEQLAPSASKRTAGRDFHYRFSGLPDKELEVVCSFFQPATSLAGAEVFDLEANGKPLLKGFDIAAEGGSDKLIERSLRVTPRSGELDLHFQGTKGKALVNEIVVKDGGQTVASVNCGTSPDKFFGYEGPENIKLKFPDMPNLSTYKPERDLYAFFASDPGRWGAGEKAGTDYCEGPTNVVVDPGFELGSKKEPTWKSIGDAPEPLLAPQVTGTGEYGWDETAWHEEKRSMRIAKTQGSFGVLGNRFVVDWTRPYEFSGWVKGEQATGKTFMEIVWYSSDAKRLSHDLVFFENEGSGASRFGAVKSGESRSEEVSGTFDWKKLAVKAQPPKGTVMAEFRLRSDDNSGTVWFDHLECDGYGALETEIVVSNGGYPTTSYKHAVVLSKTPLQELNFAILPKEGGKPAFEGKLKDLGLKKMLNRYSYLAEFSPLQEAGEYILQAKCPDGREQRSLPFSISKNGYLEVAKLAAFYFYFARCGMEIPGYHEACHQDDGWLTSEYFDDGARYEGHRDLVGGWHDAGDYGKFHSRMLVPIYSMATAALLEPPAWKNPSDDMPALAAEAAWGADYLVKISRGNGLFLAFLYGGMWGGAPQAEASVETDGIKETVDGMGRKGAGYMPHYSFTTPALALAQSALAVRPYDQKRAETYLKIAQENFDSQTAFWKAAVKPETEDWKRLIMEPKALWAATALYRATGEERFAKEADEWLLRVLPLLEKGVQKSGQFFWAEPPKQSNFQFAYIQGVMDYIETFPKSPHIERAKTAVIKEIDERIMPDTSFRNNPFGVAENLMSETLWYYPEYNYTTEFFLKTAEVLAWGAELFNRSEWRDAADRNLQWIIGNNHLQASYLAGIGERQQPGWTGLYHTPGLRRGIVPGAISKGINWGMGRFDLSWKAHNRGPLFIPYYQTRGFGSFAIHDGMGFYPHGPAAEIWEQFNGSLILSAVRLQMARMPEAKDVELEPLPLGSANLVENGGFEGKTIASSLVKEKRSMAGQDPWPILSEDFPDAWELNSGQVGEVELVTDAATARSGTKYLRVVKKDDQRAASILTGRSGKETFKVKPGETYWLRLWVRGRGAVRVFANEHKNGAYLYSRQQAQFWLTPEWQPVDIEYAVPEKSINVKEGGKQEDFDSIRIAIHLLPQGEMFLDDVMLRRSPDIKVPKATVLR